MPECLHSRPVQLSAAATGQSVHLRARFVREITGAILRPPSRGVGTAQIPQHEYSAVLNQVISIQRLTTTEMPRSIRTGFDMNASRGATSPT